MTSADPATDIGRPTGPALWLSWNESTRSGLLAQALGLELAAREWHGPLRHPVSALWTIGLLATRRPSVVLAQYSFLLLAILVAYRRLVPGVRIAADCHTKALRRDLAGPLRGVFRAVKRWSLGRADVLLLATPTLRREAQRWNRRVLVVPDPLGATPVAGGPPHRGRYVIVPSSFAADEPIEALRQAAHLLAARGGPRLVITGAVPDRVRALDWPTSVQFTGFLPRAEYEASIAGAAACVSLTTEEDCFQCAAQEALSFGVPIVTSDTRCLRAHFGDAATYVTSNAAAIADGIGSALARSDALAAAGRRLASRSRTDSERRLGRLRALLHLEGAGAGRR